MCKRISFHYNLFFQSISHLFFLWDFGVTSLCKPVSYILLYRVRVLNSVRLVSASSPSFILFSFFLFMSRGSVRTCLSVRKQVMQDAEWSIMNTLRKVATIHLNVIFDDFTNQLNDWVIILRHKMTPTTLMIIGVVMPKCLSRQNPIPVWQQFKTVKKFVAIAFR